MNIIDRNDIPYQMLPGRAIQKAVGRDSVSASERMTVGFARYSAQSGPMEPHRHAEEVCLVLEADRGYLKTGPAKDALDTVIPLHKGMVLHVGELEWHVFDYEPGGMVEIAFIYGQVDNIRPEEILAGRTTA